MLEKRLIDLREEIFGKKRGIDGFLISSLSNLFYLTGFDGEGYALITKEKNILFSDPIYTEQAQKESHQFQVITDKAGEKEARTKSIKRIIKKEKIKKMAFEGHFLSYNDFKKYADSFSIELVDGQGAVEKIRTVKDKNEIMKIRKSCRIITDSLEEVTELIEPGLSELDIATELAYTMRKKGAQKEAFEAIVVSGERSSLPHGIPSEQVIKEGELIIIDTGANYQRYNSDVTRTFIIGKENTKQKEIYQIVFEAQKRVLEALKPGIKCSEVDEIARGIIRKKGYGDYFAHALGHGVGLDVHESPIVSTNHSTVLVPGMVITIEPGIYLPGIGGVRIEDTVLITEDGYEILTWYPKTINI